MRKPLVGVACMVAATLLFAVFHAIAKWLSNDYDPFQIAFFRGVFGLLPLALLLYRARGHGFEHLASRRIDLQIARGTLGLGSIVCFILAFRTMPLADVLAISYATPVLVTVMSIPLLGERVGLHRGGAVLVGFLGIVLIVQPGTGVFDTSALLAMLGACLYALMMLVTRKLGHVDSSLCTMLHVTVFYIVVCGLLLPFVWTPPTPADWLLLAAIGFVSGGGLFFFIRAFYHGEAATIAPFDYTGMLWAIILGFLLWGDLPGWLTLCGMAIVVISGLYIMHRESRLAKHKPVPTEIAR